MYRNKREVIKSYILLVLIITSILQVGILYDYQNRGLPISFFIQLFGKSILAGSQTEVLAREQFFAPYRVSVSNGDEGHWLVDHNTDSYKKLWDEAQFYLKSIISSKHTGQTLPSEEWQNLVIKKSFLIEFKSGIRSELLRWFLQVSSAQQAEPQDLYKLLLVPAPDQMEIYILDQFGVKEYAVAYRKGGLVPDSYQALISKFEQDKDSDKKVYSMTEELGLSSRFPISPDILCVVRGPKLREYPGISYSVPQELLAEDVDDIGQSILGADKNSYDNYIDSTGTKVFKNLNNMYRIYPDGFLEYKYISGSDSSDRGELTAAFMKTGAFMNNIIKLLSNSKARIYLSSVEAGPVSYRFVFDYKVGEIPVSLDYSAKGKDGEALRNAIVIEANRQRVLSARAMLKEFEQTREVHSYNVNIGDLIKGTGINFNDIKIQEMGISYLVNSDAGSGVKPVWAIERPGSPSIFVQLKNEKGE